MQGHGLLQGEIIAKMQNYIENISKSFSPDPLGQFQPNMAQSILGFRGFMFVQMTGHALIQGEIIANKKNYIENIKKYFCSEPLGQFLQTWHKASLDGGDSSLFK